MKKSKYENLEKYLRQILTPKKSGSLFNRESQTLEFKEQFNLASLAEYFKDFSAFANNQGGYLICGVTNSPRKPVGLSEKSIEQFEKIDEEKITNYLNEGFSPEIEWERVLIQIGNKKFGVFQIKESKYKPVIAKRNQGKDNEIIDGEIYYRYGGRTQKVAYSELNNLIQERMNQINIQWQNLTSKIAKAGPDNAAILDTERGLISRGERTNLIIDEDLVKKIKFIREGEFSEKKGSVTLRLVGDIKTVDQIEVTKILEKRLIDQYPLSYAKVVQSIKEKVSSVKINKIQLIIKESDLKNDKRYSAYNFRTKDQETNSNLTGKIPSGTPSIYNDSAVKLVLKILDNSN